MSEKGVLINSPLGAFKSALRRPMRICIIIQRKIPATVIVLSIDAFDERVDGRNIN